MGVAPARSPNRITGYAEPQMSPTVTSSARFRRSSSGVVTWILAENGDGGVPEPVRRPRRRAGITYPPRSRGRRRLGRPAGPEEMQRHPRTSADSGEPAANSGMGTYLVSGATEGESIWVARVCEHHAGAPDAGPTGAGPVRAPATRGSEGISDGDDVPLFHSGNRISLPIESGHTAEPPGGRRSMGCRSNFFPILESFRNGRTRGHMQDHGYPVQAGTLSTPGGRRGSHLRSAGKLPLRRIPSERTRRGRDRYHPLPGDDALRRGLGGSNSPHPALFRPDRRRVGVPDGARRPGTLPAQFPDPLHGHSAHGIRGPMGREGRSDRSLVPRGTDGPRRTPSNLHRGPSRDGRGGRRDPHRSAGSPTQRPGLRDVSRILVAA